jgi:hypothetical protein
MSHWHRAPRAISVCSLVQRYAKCILLDRAIEVPAGNLKALSKDIQTLCVMDPGGKLSLAQIARLCQELHALLVTPDTEVIPMLIADGGASWGALLTLPGRISQAEVLERLAADQLSVRPSVDQELMAEYVARNRLLIDLRSSKPSIGVFCNCRWSRAQE